MTPHALRSTRPSVSPIRSLWIAAVTLVLCPSIALAQSPWERAASNSGPTFFTRTLFAI